MMVRLIGERTWAIGIRSDEYLFLFDKKPDGNPCFIAVPKDGETDPKAVNWIAKNKQGEFYDFGVSY